MSTFDDLLDEYWNLAHAEGKEGRSHDTLAGDAARVRYALVTMFETGRGTLPAPGTFDAADYIPEPEAQELFIAQAFETKDPAYINDALAAVARARGGSFLDAERQAARIAAIEDCIRLVAEATDDSHAIIRLERLLEEAGGK